MTCQSIAAIPCYDTFSRLTQILYLFLLPSITTAAPAPTPITVEALPDMRVSQYNINTFATPIAFHNDTVYVANIEPKGDINSTEFVNTVVRKLDLGSKTREWESNILEPRTVKDKYHAQASIGIDEEGYIHIAYNMHNFPWQYSVSSRPDDISNFTFQGEAITLAELRRHTRQNKTNFANPGAAKIPGTQITYPAFFRDHRQKLHVTYRHALEPSASFGQRLFAGSIARYNAKTQTWTQIGGHHYNSSGHHSMPFAFAKDWWVYLPVLAFDSQDKTHVAWSWRHRSPGIDMHALNYGWLTSDNAGLQDGDNQLHPLPVDRLKNVLPTNNGSYEHFAHVHLALDRDQIPHLVFGSRAGQNRQLTYWQADQGSWSTPTVMPSSASTIEFSLDNRAWAFATGPKIYTRDAGVWKIVWQPSDEANSFGHIKVINLARQKVFFLYTQHTTQNLARVFVVKY